MYYFKIVEFTLLEAMLLYITDCLCVVCVCVVLIFEYSKHVAALFALHGFCLCFFFMCVYASVWFIVSCMLAYL